MAEKKKTRERKTYSVYRLEHCEGKHDPQNPDTQFVLVAYFNDESDAVTAARLLKDHPSYDSYHFGVVKEIRTKELTPKISRKIV